MTDAGALDPYLKRLVASGLRCRIHIREVDRAAPEFGVEADAPVVLASVSKILLVLEYARQVVSGRIDPAERVRVGPDDRHGGLGVAGCQDDVDVSWRDLALFAMSLSDNTAADMLFHRVGLAAVQDLAVELGLASTRIVGGPRHSLRSMFDDIGARDKDEFARLFPTLDQAALSGLGVLDPARANASTPREMTGLLAAIWRDEAGPASACAQVRELMGRQASWHRLAAGFPEAVAVSAKAGTILHVRNEVGVAVYPDGRRYAVAVFTDGGWGTRRADVDRAIGDVARLGVERLRAGE